MKELIFSPSLTPFPCTLRESVFVSGLELASASQVLGLKLYIKEEFSE